MSSAHLAQVILPSSLHRAVAPHKQCVIPPACSMHELRTLRCAEIRRRNVARRVLRDELHVGDTQGSEAVPPEQPCIALDIEHDEMAAAAGRVDGH